MMLWILLLLLAETPQEHAARLRAQMQASIAAQREAVHRQSEMARASSPRPVRVSGSNSARDPLPSVVFLEPPACEPLPAAELANLVNSAAQAQSLNPFLVQEVARQESEFRPCAVSSQGAMGLMQLMPLTQIELDVNDPWDARQSIEAGSRLLRQLLDRYHGDVALALSAYNAGVGRVDQAGGIPAIPETRNYVESILDRVFQGTGTQPPGIGSSTWSIWPGFSPGALLGGLAGSLNDGP